MYRLTGCRKRSGNRGNDIVSNTLEEFDGKFTQMPAPPVDFCHFVENGRMPTATIEYFSALATPILPLEVSL